MLFKIVVAAAFVTIYLSVGLGFARGVAAPPEYKFSAIMAWPAGLGMIIGRISQMRWDGETNLESSGESR